MKTYCEQRKLWIRKPENCRTCTWYECTDHPRHVPKGMLEKYLADCMTKKWKRSDLKSKKIKWDGRKQTCRRWRWYQNEIHRQIYDDPCEVCALPRKCKHRGETGKSNLNIIEHLGT